KVAPPFKVVEFDIMYGQGISKMGELLDLGVKAGVVDKSGSWFSYGDQRIGQGRENVKQFLAENIDMADEIERKVRANAGLIAEAIIGEPIPSADAVDTADDADSADGRDATLGGLA
ncbi:MAG: DNA recombination/repair protein RecA, partial [Alphaproteobacteria bacterium]|nr:DNA recombination/repair protein RecA [Alphaproteobacteria bacterium]